MAAVDPEVLPGSRGQNILAKPKEGTEKDKLRHCPSSSSASPKTLERSGATLIVFLWHSVV